MLSDGKLLGPYTQVMVLHAQEATGMCLAYPLHHVILFKSLDSCEIIPRLQ